MNTYQIRYVAKSTKQKSRTHQGRIEAYEAGAQIAQSHTAARLARGGWWNPYASTGSSVTVYKRGQEPAL